MQDGQQHLKCKLKKAIYGLQQSARVWYKNTEATFEREGFSKSHADHSLYIKQTNKSLLIVIIYIDGLIILVSDMDMMKRLKFRLEEESDMSDLSELHFFFGVHIERNKAVRTIVMHQRSYLEEVLK